MTPLATLLLLGNLICDTAGQLSFKAASLRAGDKHGLERWLHMARSGPLAFGIACFVLEAFLWLSFLSIVPLAQGVMVGSINIIGVMIGGRLLFRESITPKRAIAISLIAGGVALVGWGGP
jgi:drug/metabolite transporter (DMT)-like permease